MREEDEGRPEAPPPVTPATADAGKAKPGMAKMTGFLAGRTVTGLARLALRNRTVRNTVRNARDANREDK